MTVTADAPADTSLSEHIHDKLSGPAPVTLADLKQGGPKPPKAKRGEPKPDPLARLRDALAEAVRDGRAFAHPSGKGGAERYWHRDEAEAVRAAVRTAAGEPRTLAELRKAGAAGLKADAGFVDGVVRGLIGDDRLFEHPAKTPKGGPRFATAPPPPPLPPLAWGKFPSRVAKLLTDAAKLGKDAGVPVEEVLAAVRALLAPVDAEPASQPDEVDELILSAVAVAAPTLPLADLRGQMPAAHRGPAFDAAVLRLAAAKRVQVFTDGEPLQFPEEVREGFVQDPHGNVYTHVGPREGM
jgi:hypothetical protein